MSRLAAVQKGRLKEPFKIIIYGPEGIGKSTLAAYSPDPIWLDIEGNSGHLDVARFPFHDGPSGHRAKNYKDVLGAIKDLRTDPHNYKTLVVDTIDFLEKQLHEYVVRRDKAIPDGEKEQAPGIEAYGFNKGYTVATEEFRNFVHECDLLRDERQMNIILLAHCHVEKFEPPTGAPYDRYTMRMHKKASALLREWVKAVGFAYYEEGVVKDGKYGKAKGIDTGRRLIDFRRKATHDAKTHYPLPDQIEMPLENPWAPFEKALSDAQNMTVAQLREAIQAECERIGDPEVNERVKKYVDSTDSAVLNEVLGKLKEKEAKTNAS